MARPNRPAVRAALAAGCGLVLSVGLLGATTSAETRDVSAALSADECVTEPEGAAGRLEFSTATLSVSESTPERVILVLRTGGSAGPVSATVRSSDETATAGTDYTAVDTTVAFEDGDDTVQLVRVPIVPDSRREENETLTVTMSNPVCATLGTNTAVDVIIVNDDAAESFVLGGTVSGLQGSGLVLRTNFFEDVSPVNGAFVFPRGLVAGSSYQVSVLTQPSNPSQICTVGNGVGVMPEDDVLNLLVTCDPPLSNPHLDPSFGIGGLVTTAGVRGAQAVVVQPDGKIVTAGDNSLARYLPDGSPDFGFGANGAVVTGLDAAFLGEAIDVALQVDGSIVVVGVVDNRATTREDFAIQRYDANGVVDATFGTGGQVTTDFNGGSDRAYAVAVQRDGAILVAGHAAGQGAAGSDFALARYTPAGVPDETFDGDGKLTTDFGGSSDFGHALVLDADGGAVVAGRVIADGSFDENFGVARYTTTGAVDASFGGTGTVIIDFGGGSIAKGVALDPEGRIIVVGSTPNPESFTLGSDFAVARLLPSGARDGGFGTDGLVTTDIGAPDAQTHNDFAGDVLVQADGTVVVVGSTQFPGGSDLAVTRYRGDGTLDATFGDIGRLSVDFHEGFDAGTDLAVQPTSGRMVVVGSAGNGFTVENAVARLLP